MGRMKLYLLSQDVNDDYDTYDSCVVAAENEEEAKMMHPAGENRNIHSVFTWCNMPDAVRCKYIGEAAENIEKGVICASFNAA